MIEDFKKRLEKLLLKFPELPEFTLTVRPRVSIDVEKPKAFTPSNSQVPATKFITNPHPIDATKPDEMNIGLLKERDITPDKLEFYKKFGSTE